MIRVMNQAHMEQNTRIRATEVTVITRLYQKAERKPWVPMAFLKFSSPAKVSAIGS